MSDAALLRAIADMQAGNITVEREESEPVFDGGTGLSVAPPYPPRLMFAGIYATRLAAEMVAVMDELEQLRSKVEAGRREVVTDMIERLKDSLKESA